MIFRVRMTVRSRHSDPGGNLKGLQQQQVREVTTQFAGCLDAEDARRKARLTYDVVKFKSAEEVQA